MKWARKSKLILQSYNNGLGYLQSWKLGPMGLECIEFCQAIAKPIREWKISDVSNNFRSEEVTSLGISTFNLRCIKHEISPSLHPVINNIVHCSYKFTNQQHEAGLFFIYMGGEAKGDPEHHQTICHQNFIQKTFMKIIENRMDQLSKMHELHPKFQFGFRRQRSALSAAVLLHQTVSTRLGDKKRT